MAHGKIGQVAHYAPRSQVVTNDDPSKITDVFRGADEWDSCSRTGIQERRISLNEYE